MILNDGDILLGSVNQNKIVKVDQDGNMTDWLYLPYSVLGMKVDKQTGFLWVATAVTKYMQGFELRNMGESIVFQIDTASGRIIQGLEFNEEEQFGDLVLDSQSRLWLTNSIRPYLSRDNTDTLFNIGSFVRKQFDLDASFFDLQGLTLNDDESILYFADRVLGIHKLDIAPDEITKIQSNKYISPIGIDGLYYYNNALIAIHNGVNPFKIVQYLLDVESANVIGQKYINRAGPSLGQPTLGQIKDGYFYYISNSLRDAYDADGKLQFEKVPALQIRRFRLN